MRTLTLKVSPGYHTKYTVTLSEWDLGVPFGDADTIQEAIDEFLDSWELRFDYRPDFKWT